LGCADEPAASSAHFDSAISGSVAFVQQVASSPRPKAHHPESLRLGSRDRLAEHQEDQGLHEKTISSLASKSTAWPLGRVDSNRNFSRDLARC